MDDNGGEWVQQTVDGNSFWYYYDSNGDMVTGWIKSDGYWYYCYGDGTMARDTMVDGCYVNNDGQWTKDKGPREIIDGNGDHFSYYINPDGKAVTGWNKIGDNFHYYNYPGGSMTYDNTIKGSYSDSEEFYIDDDGNIASGTGWIKDEYSGKCYYYLEGSMQTGWVKYGDSWYYLKDDGSMATGWQYINGFWYYLQSDGSMAANKWVNDGSGWYYLYKDGSMARGTTANGYYVCQETGKMVAGAGWQHIDNKYFYLNGDDSVVTGWLEDKNIWYYFYPENSDSYYQGEMAEDTTIDGWNVGDDGGWINGTGWKQNGDDWYYFDDSGKMMTNTWIQGKDSDDWYYVGSDGKMMKSTYIKGADGTTICFASDGKSFVGDDGRVEDVNDLNKEPSILGMGTTITADDYDFSNPIPDDDVPINPSMVTPLGLAATVFTGIVAHSEPVGQTQEEEDEAIEEYNKTHTEIVEGMPTKWPWSALPSTGSYPFVPPKDKAGNPVLKKDRDSGGAIDQDGNVWTRDKQAERVGNGHWDVKLKDGDHLNVNGDDVDNPGEINHGKGK